MTRSTLLLMTAALFAVPAQAAETSDVAVPPALAEALAEVEPAALEALVADAKAKAKAKAEAEAREAAAAKAAAEEKAREEKALAEAQKAEEALATAKAEAAAKALAEAEAVALTAAADAASAKAALAAVKPSEAKDVAPVASAKPAAPAAPDLKLAAVLAELDGQNQKSVETPTPATTASVNPLARAVSVFLVALLFGVFLVVHPKTRQMVLARIRGANPLEELEVEALVIRTRQTVGPGQSLVDLELDGVRLLVGVSPGRMDLLHAWGPVPALAEAMTSAPRPALIAGAQPATPAPRPAAPAPSPAADEVAPPPSVDQLLEAWKGTVVQNATAEPAEAPAADVPWWLEGASEDERSRIEDQAASTDELAESVLARIRTARSQEVDAPAPTPLPAARANHAPPKESPQVILRRSKGRALGTLALLGAVLLPSLFGFDTAMAEELSAGSGLQVSLDGAGAGTSTAVKLLVTLTLMAVAPAIVLSMTSFTRMIVVFSLMRQAVGVQQAPPNQVLIGLALFLTWFVMGPTFDRVNDLAVQPYASGQMSEGEAIGAAMGPMRDFMMSNTRESDLALFLRLSDAPRPETRADVPTNALVPAFLISELKTAFQIGFLIYIPFLIIDVVVSTVLLAMGMMVLPPVVISLPFKLLLFVFVDGWNLLVGSMVQSFA